MKIRKWKMNKCSYREICSTNHWWCNRYTLEIERALKKSPILETYVSAHDGEPSESRALPRHRKSRVIPRPVSSLSSSSGTSSMRFQLLALVPSYVVGKNDNRKEALFVKVDVSVVAMRLFLKTSRRWVICQYMIIRMFVWYGKS